MVLRLALLLCGFVVLGAVGGQAAPQKDLAFYVSPAGNDAWSGRRGTPNAARTDGPFASIERARDAIRALPAAQRVGSVIAVHLRAGAYRLAAPLVFGPGDGGVTYQAYRNEKPVISGGRVISGWRQGEKQIWEASVPGVKEGQWYFRQLFVNDQRARRARTPNTDSFEVERRPGADGEQQEGGRQRRGQPGSFAYREKDVNPEWGQLGDVEVVAVQAWTTTRIPIASVDAATRQVVLAGPARGGDQYWIENAPDALDSPGEWYLDRRTGILRYWPRAGEDMRHAEVVAPVLEQVVRLVGDPAKGEFVNNLHFRGLTFAHTDWPLEPTGRTDQQAATEAPVAFVADGAHGVSVENCLFTHLGGYAIAFRSGCTDNILVHSELTDLGGGGVMIGDGSRPRTQQERTERNELRSNHIHDLGVVYPPAVGVWVGQSGDNKICNNHIHDTYYSGISIGWSWGYEETDTKGNLVEGNHVHDIGRGMLDDMGGIYTLGLQPGAVIRGNVFHDVTCRDYGGWGIYFDEGSTGILAENNVVFNTESGGFDQHYGHDNIVRNNIFASSRRAQVCRGWTADGKPDGHNSFTFEHNIVYWTQGELLRGNWPDNEYRFDSNLYFNAAGGPVDFDDLSLAEWQAKGQDRHSLLADPLFQNPHRYDFRLKAGSPAFAFGFRNGAIPLCDTVDR